MQVYIKHVCTFGCRLGRYWKGLRSRQHVASNQPYLPPFAMLVWWGDTWDIIFSSSHPQSYNSTGLASGIATETEIGTHAGQAKNRLVTSQDTPQYPGSGACGAAGDAREPRLSITSMLACFQMDDEHPLGLYCVCRTYQTYTPAGGSGVRCVLGKYSGLKKRPTVLSGRANDDDNNDAHGAGAGLPRPRSPIARV